MEKTIKKLLPKNIKLYTTYELNGSDGKYVFYKDSFKTMIKRVEKHQTYNHFSHMNNISEKFNYDLPTKIPFQLIQFAYTYFANTFAKSPFKKFLSIYYISNKELFEENKHQLGNYFVQHGDYIIYIPEKIIHDNKGNVNVGKSLTETDSLNYLKPSEFGTRIVLNVISFVKSNYDKNEVFKSNVFKGNDLLVISDIQPLADNPFHLEIFSTFKYGGKQLHFNHNSSSYIDLPIITYDLVSTLNEQQYEKDIPFKEYKSTLSYVYLSNKLLPSPHFNVNMLRK